MSHDQYRYITRAFSEQVLFDKGKLKITSLKFFLFCDNERFVRCNTRARTHTHTHTQARAHTHTHTVCIGGSKGRRQGCAPPIWVQILSFSCSFGGKLCKIIGWSLHIYCWRPSFEKSWIRHCTHTLRIGKHFNLCR